MSYFGIDILFFKSFICAIVYAIIVKEFYAGFIFATTVVPHEL